LVQEEAETCMAAFLGLVVAVDEEVLVEVVA
jgi:hypothetical protein